MSADAVVFMLLTMGAVVGLNVVCLRAWVHARRAAPDSDGAAREGSEKAS